MGFKKKFLLSSIAFISACTAILLFAREQYFDDISVYAGLGEVPTQFQLSDGLYAVGDAIGEVNSCKSNMFPECIYFDSTVIMIPLLNDIIGADEKYFEGKNEELNLEYELSKIEILILGRKVDGFLFRIGQKKNLFKTDENIKDQLEGEYFYSPEFGIVFYKHYSDILSLNSEKSRVSELLWSTKMCGMFAPDEC